MTFDASKYVTDALAALEKVETEQQLVLWDGDWCNSHDYLQLPESAVCRLEEAYQRKLAWFYGIGAG
jgi:hypothetical protein